MNNHFIGDKFSAIALPEPLSPIGGPIRVWDLFNLPRITGFQGHADARTAMLRARDGNSQATPPQLGYAFDFNTQDPQNDQHFAAIANLQALEDDLVSNYSLIVSQVRDLLGQESLDDVEKLILGDRHSYVALLRRAIYQTTGPVSAPVSPDPGAVKFYLMQLVGDAAKRFYTEITHQFFDDNNISADPNTQSAVIDRLKLSGIYVQDPYSSINDVYQVVKKLGNLPYLVDTFFNKGEILSDSITDALKAEMVNFLRTLNLNTSIIAASVTPDPVSGLDVMGESFDEYFVAAYQHSLKVSSGLEDPIFQVYNPNYSSSWNLEVDLFENLEDQANIPDHVRAAGALQYCYILGEVMGIYHVVDYLTLMWAQGRLALSRGEASTKLYSYFKRRDDRMTNEERAMTWKQVLNLGNAPTMQNLVVNTEYTHLMDTLLKNVVEFMSKTESFDSGSGNVSPESIFISINGLQGNLSSYMVGKPLADVHELYAQLKDCLEILKTEEIRDQLGGGRQKNIWAVIGKVLREDLKRNVSVPAAKAAAVEVNKMFNYIANFDYSRRHYSSLSDFIQSTEAYILAYEQLGSAVESPMKGHDSHHSHRADGMDEFEDEAFDDDFDNWD